MRIRFNEKAAIQFLAAAVTSGDNEFSGVGFCKRQDDALEIYDLRILNYGGYASTTITPEAIAGVLSEPGVAKDDLRAWVHKHPLGHGRPGKENWSSTDDHTILHSPLGGIPEMVGWSASVVLTPHGPVGRIDNHLAKKTRHVAVELPFVDLYQMSLGRVIEVGKNPVGLAEKLQKVADDLEWLLDQVSPALAEAINELEHLANEEDEWITPATAEFSTPLT